MPRCNINWRAIEALQLLVAVAWFFFKERNVHNKMELWGRVKEHLPDISLSLLGREGAVTLDGLVEYVKNTQDDLEITPHKLLQRADKAERYDEAKFFKSTVTDYYDGKQERVLRDPVRFFTDDQLRIAIDIHGKHCTFCEAPFNELAWPVADHYMPYSKGGPTNQNNCYPACVRCNQEKGDMLPHVFQRMLDKRNLNGRKNI